jgi:hypothetical protein
VPFREGEHFYESALQRDDGKTSKGAFGRAVRPLPEAACLPSTTISQFSPSVAACPRTPPA